MFIFYEFIMSIEEIKNFFLKKITSDEKKLNFNNNLTQTQMHTVSYLLLLCFVLFNDHENHINVYFNSPQSNAITNIHMDLLLIVLVLKFVNVLMKKSKDIEHSVRNDHSSDDLFGYPIAVNYNVNGTDTYETIDSLEEYLSTNNMVQHDTVFSIEELTNEELSFDQKT